MMEKYKTFLDTVHGYITVPESFCDSFIDTSNFQRLRRIEQLSSRSLFPCARHDRFVHSLGVYHIGKKFVDAIKNNYPDLDKQLEVTFLIACLLHDVGHSPFSHTLEYCFGRTDELFAIYKKSLEKTEENDDLNEIDVERTDVKPHEILLVVDAMTGQDAVNVAESFNNDLGLDGVILTKMDGDARGGAALSVKAVTGCPIKFVGAGEKLEALEPFYPDRMASRILGMGDVLTLIEKAQTAFDAEEAKKMEKAFRKNEFTLDDFLSQLNQVRKLGSFENILGMIPGMGGLKKKLGDVDIDMNGKEIKHIEAIIRAMTPEEKRNTKIINGSRRKRIAMGSGTKVQEVNKLLKQFDEMKKMMKKMSNMKQLNKKGKKGKGGFKLPFFR